MLAPPSPEMSELITTAFLRRVLERLRDTHDLVIVDSWPWFHDTTLGLLDLSDEILALLTLEITNIKNIRLFLEVADQLGYPAGKIKLVLNRADSALGIRVSDVEHSIGRRIDETIVSDGRSVVYALNRGVPFVTSNREAQVSQDIIRLARSVIGEAVRPAAQRENRSNGSRCSHGADSRSWSREGRKGRAVDVPAEADRECPAWGRRGAAAHRASRGAPGGSAAASGPSRIMSQAPVRESFRDVKFRIQSRVIQDLDPKLDLSNQVEVRRQIEEIFGRVIDEEGLALTRAERVRMLEQITDEIIGLGPLEPLLRDESITEVMVNGPRQVYIERAGKLELTNVVFQNDDHVMRIIDRIIAPIGRRVDESSPDGGRPPDRRLPRQRHHPAAVPGRAGHHDPEVLGLAVHRRRPDPLRHRHPRDVRLPARPASRPASTSSSPAAPAPARPRRSTCSPRSSPTTSAS